MANDRDGQGNGGRDSSGASGGGTGKSKDSGSNGAKGDGSRNANGPAGSAKEAASNPKGRTEGSTNSKLGDRGYSGAGSGRNGDTSGAGDVTSWSHVFDRMPGPLEAFGNIVNGTPTADDIVGAGASVIGAATGTPAGSVVGLGIGMGRAVSDVQDAVDDGTVSSTRADDPSMGRVDKVGGEAFSHGNPAADDRASNENGLGGGMTGGNSGANSGVSGGGLMTGPADIQVNGPRAPSVNYSATPRGLLKQGDPQQVMDANNNNPTPGQKFVRYQWDPATKQLIALTA